MRTSRHCFSRTPRFVPIALCITLAVAATAQSPDVRELLDRMEASHAFPPGCSMTASAEATTTWFGTPDLSATGPTEIFRDRWTAMSDCHRYGVEVHYETHQGGTHWRTVYGAGERRRFDFDAEGTSDPAALGALSAWRDQGEAWPAPITQYLDRMFMEPELSGRRGPSYNVAEQMEKVDGHACHVVLIYWKGRTMELWLDPAMGCLPRKYLMRNDVWRGQDTRDGQSRTAPATGLRIQVPDGLERALGQPVAYDERSERIELATHGAWPYIARADFVKTLIFEHGASHVEEVALTVDSIEASSEAEREPFLAFAGLMNNDDRVRLYEPGGDGYYVNMAWRDGQLVEMSFSLTNLVGSIRQSYWRMTNNFSVERLREMDIRLVIGLCAILAVGINGGLIWASRRRRATKGAGTEAGERADGPVAD